VILDIDFKVMGVIKSIDALDLLCVMCAADALSVRDS